MLTRASVPTAQHFGILFSHTTLPDELKANPGLGQQ